MHTPTRNSQEYPPPPPLGHEDIAVLGQFCAEVMDHFTFL